MTDAPTVLCVSPHPDDELLGAGATLFALRDAGWRVVNLAVSLGRPDDRARRHAELTEACRRARFELVIADAAEDPRTAVSGALWQSRAGLIVGPSPHDGHPAHESAGRAIVEAVQDASRPVDVMFWGLWADLPFPNVFTAFDRARLQELQTALAAHAGQLQRNRFDRLLEARAIANAVLGAERVNGFGASGTAAEYAELLIRLSWNPDDRRWERAALDGSVADVGWWLHGASARTLLASSADRSPVG